MRPKFVAVWYYTPPFVSWNERGGRRGVNATAKTEALAKNSKVPFLRSRMWAGPSPGRLAGSNRRRSGTGEKRVRRRQIVARRREPRPSRPRRGAWQRPSGRRGPVCLKKKILWWAFSHVRFFSDGGEDTLSPWLSENATILSWHSEHQIWSTRTR